MVIQDYLRVARDRWKIIAVMVLLGVIASLVYFFVRPPEYTATTSLYVSAQTSSDAQQAFQGAQLSEQRVKSYNELVTGDRVMGETVQRLGLNIAADQLAARVTASSPLDSVIINVAATDRSPQQAASIANTVASVTSEVVAELERPTSPNDVPTVVVRSVQPATPPERPSSLGLPFVVLIGFLIGIGAGTAAALIRNALDTSVKTLSMLSDIVGAPGLGVTIYESTQKERPLTVHDDPQSANAEAFRRLRTNLQFIDVDQPRKVILITSAVPGEGKTTGVANLAIAVASTATRVLVIEADLRRPKLSKLLGMDRSVGLTRVLSGRVSLRDAIQPWNGGAFDVLASGPTPPNPSELLASNQMRTLLDDTRGSYDLVLIDTPPLLPVADAAAIAPATDGAVLFCRYNSTTRTQIDSAATALRSVSIEPLATVLTMAPRTRGSTGYTTTYGTDPDARASESLTGRTPPTWRGPAGADSLTERQLYRSNEAPRPTPERRSSERDAGRGWH